MAFSQSIKRGQAPISCNLCEVETKITSKCLDCDLLMCSKCKEKVHPKFKNAKAHQIVDIKEVGRHPVQPDHGTPDLTSVKCQEHTEQTCCLFCKSCDQLVCPLCIEEKIHNSHELVQIIKGYEIRKERLKERLEKVSADLDELTRSELEIKEIQKNEHSKYQDVKERIKEQNTALKKAVDKYTEDLMKELDQKWIELQGKTEEEKNKINKRIKTLEEQKLKINNLITTNEVLSDVDQSFPESNNSELKMTFDPIPVFIPGEISQYNFGQLNKPSAAVNITVSKTFTTELDIVSNMSPGSENSFWICSSILPGLLQNIRTDGTNMKVISSYPVRVYGMALTPSNDLLLVTYPSSTLQTISSGKLTDTKYTVAPLDPTAVHVTSQNKVIVGAWDGEDDVCVIVMDMNGKQEHKYKHDKNSEPLFRYVLGITSARNGNIFVIDEISDDRKGRVVVLGQNGDVVNIYKGHPDINSKEEPFIPGDIVCTSSDNVIVVNLDIHTLHILNKSGHLIKYYKVSDLGIIHPVSLAYTSSQTLYIGCSFAVGSTEKQAKLYEVNISDC